MSDVLYHYTSAMQLPIILHAGFLKLTENNLIEPISKEDTKPKPESELHKPVVWLTRSESPRGNGLEGASVYKGEIRIVVNKRSHYDPWLLWSRNNRIEKKWAKKLESVGNPNNWYVSEQIIFLNEKELVRIENTVSGEVLIDVNEGIRQCSVTVFKPQGFSESSFAKYLSDKALSDGEVVIFELK